VLASDSVTVGCTAKDETNKEYGVQIVGTELNIYITEMYGTTNIK
jgi:hypothetical protein